MTAPWQLDLLWGVVNGLATGAISVPLAAMIANRWFVERRGLVTGMLTASNATGQLIFLPRLAWHRDAASAGATRRSRVRRRRCVVVLPLVALFIRDRPADLGLAPYGADRDRAGAASRSAIRSLPRSSTACASARELATFWLLAGSFFICGASTNGLIGTHLIPAAIDHGIAEVAAAGAARDDRGVRHRRHDRAPAG